MFARNVSIHLKYNMLSEYGHVFESQVLPLLRKQKGFRDEITFARPGGLDVTAISLWDNKADAEAYNTSAYPKVLKTFAKVIDGTPMVETCEVINSTFHKITVPVHA
jgi:heme-degrading monooxygenase HmoA